MQRAWPCSLAFLSTIFAGWIEWEWMAAEVEPHVSTQKGTSGWEHQQDGDLVAQGHYLDGSGTKALLSPSTQYLHPPAKPGVAM